MTIAQMLAELVEMPKGTTTINLDTGTIDTLDAVKARLALAVALLERAEYALLQYKHRDTMVCADLRIAIPRLKEGLQS